MFGYININQKELTEEGKKAIRPASKVFEIIKENSGSQFDPNLAEIFCELQQEITDISE